MKRKFALLLSIVFIFGFMLSACRTDAVDRQLDQGRLDRIYAIEDKYETYLDKTMLVVDQYLPLIQVKGMINLSKQSVINGRLTAFVGRIGTTSDGSVIPRYTDYIVTQANKDLLSVRFIADERLEFSDETVVFVMVADSLIFNMRRIANDASSNSNFEKIYNIFEAKRQEQGQAPLTIDELPEAFISFVGDNTKDLTIQLLYYKNGKNEVEFKFNDIYDYLTEKGQDFFRFVEEDYDIEEHIDELDDEE